MSMDLKRTMDLKRRKFERQQREKSLRRPVSTDHSREFGHAIRAAKSNKDETEKYRRLSSGLH